MIKGKVSKILPKGFGFVSSDELPDDSFCPPKLVDKYKLEEGDYVEFEQTKSDRGYQVTKIRKVENPLFKLALNITNLNAEKYDEFCDLTKKYVNEKNFRDNITTTKIRNIFTAVQNAKNIKNLKMLRPKFAYLAGRDKKTKFFMNDLDKLVRKVSNEDELNSFKQFFEAIVCYKKEIEK